MLGDMPEPAGFRYQTILNRGRPRHGETDAFRIRHPSMDAGRRAKLFAPFDALRGFGEAVASKDVLYEPRKELNEEEAAELDRRLWILRSLCAGNRMLREKRVQVTVSYFVPCNDPENEAYGLRGQYRQISGICRSVDAERSRTVLIGETRIRLADIQSLESETGIFDREWEECG